MSEFVDEVARDRVEQLGTIVKRNTEELDSMGNLYLGHIRRTKRLEDGNKDILNALELSERIIEEHHRILHGHPDDRFSESEPGVVLTVYRLNETYKQVRTIVRIVWAMAGLTGVNIIVTLSNKG